MTQPIYFISLGPGDAGHVTCKALRLLQEADCIFCPSTCTPNGDETSRAQSLLLELGIAPSAIHLFCVPMKANRDAARAVYLDTASQIAACSRSGKQVAVTVEGDASIYASIHYLMNELQSQGHTLTQVCGIPSFIAATESACLSLVELEERLAVIPGNATADELEQYLKTGHTVVILKLSRCSESVKTLLHRQPDIRCQYHENVSIADKAYSTTDSVEIMAREFPYFSLIILKAPQTD